MKNKHIIDMEDMAGDELFRLLELGFVHGTEVDLLFKSGDRSAVSDGNWTYIVPTKILKKK